MKEDYEYFAKLGTLRMVRFETLFKRGQGPSHVVMISPEYVISFTLIQNHFTMECVFKERNSNPEARCYTKEMIIDQVLKLSCCLMHSSISD